MLDELAINSLGVIESSTAEFSPGLTVLTGETGAGKTMIVTSLHLLAGGRADATRVRSGAAKATVEGRLRLGGRLTPETAELLADSGAELDDGDTLIAVRTVGADGRSRAYLGGRSVPVGTMGRVVGELIAIHGQNDQLRLIKPDQQRAAVDEFAGTTTAAALETYRKRRSRWIEILDELDRRRADSRALAQEADQLRFGIEEIDRLDPAPGEDEQLTATIKQLTDLESLREAAGGAHRIISGADGSSVVDGLGQVRGLLGGVEEPALSALVERVEEALVVVGDIGDELSGYLGGLPSDADDLDGLMTRQAELRALTRKYAADIDGVLAWRDEARRRLAEIEDPAQSIEELEAAAAAARAEVATAAEKLHGRRSRAAKRLGTRVSEELAGLAMGGAELAVTVGLLPAEDDRLAITVDDQPAHAGPFGADRVEFGLVAHRGAEPMPIARSASGGELSRVMLALEVVLAEADSGSIMVFDEVDAGVGGGAAVEIGRRLARLARAHQVIVVTHLPQVAAFADQHMVIGKTGGGRTKVTSTVTGLDRDERVAELARMLAGLGDTDTGRAHAEELLGIAEQEKADWQQKPAT